MGPYQQTPKVVARAIRYSGLGVRSVGPVGDFLESYLIYFCESYPFEKLLIVNLDHFYG